LGRQGGLVSRCLLAAEALPLITATIVLAHLYLLLRVAAHFRRFPRWAHWLAVAGLLASVMADGAAAEGDERLLRVALENLLGNAWKFTAKRARARVEFGLRQINGGPVYYVRDNGAGFDMKYAGQLFAAFQRLHGPGEFPGTGIGLATVRRIVHRHGGRVCAEGEAGRGATVYFTLA
jgi:light-regulated signal transduction histidine kinase (bacteriophytochrome)